MIAGLIERNPRFANWLYGFTPPERGTVVLVHRRVYIVPTRLGWLFAGTLTILLVGSINYALALGLTFLLAGMGIAGMVQTARNLARLAVSAGRAEPVFAGDTTQFRLYLDGRVAFDRPAILVRHMGCGAQLVLDIPAGGVGEVVLPVPAARRGWLALGRRRAASSIRAPKNPPCPRPAAKPRAARCARPCPATTTSPACAATSLPTRRGTSPGRRLPGPTTC